jgi:Flp pilus assembly protein TadG
VNGFAVKRLIEWQMSLKVATLRRRATAASRGSLLRSRCGATALEFALVAPPFLILVFGVMEIGYDLFVQGALSAAVQQAARSVQTGAVQGTSGETSAQFVAAAVCPAVGGRLTCAQIVAGVKPVPSGYNYYSNPSPLTLAGAAGGAVCTGVGGQTMLIQAWYLGPTFAGLLIPSFSTTYNGSVVHITSASAGFVNEYFTGGQTTGTGC